MISQSEIKSKCYWEQTVICLQHQLVQIHAAHLTNSSEHKDLTPRCARDINICVTL